MGAPAETGEIVAGRSTIDSETIPFEVTADCDVSVKDHAHPGRVVSVRWRTDT